MTIGQLRKRYHRRICQEILRVKEKNGHKYPNNADGDSKISVKIAWGVVNKLGCKLIGKKLSGQTAGNLFEQITRDFLRESFELLQHLRPGKWIYSIRTAISDFDQYKDLAIIEGIVKHNRELSTTLGQDYIIRPDIVIARKPLSDEEINHFETIIDDREPFALHTPLRQKGEENPYPILHASISCKWTLRSDRAQNIRTEALNLIRNRKGKLPHIVAVTAEPMLSRIASLALGTGDIDCVYHFALKELEAVIDELGDETQKELLSMLVLGNRLRDISDLPFDLAI